MKLFIPEIGTEFRIIEEWKFSLYSEPRNGELLKYGGFPAPKWVENPPIHPYSFPVGTLLKVDRIYIRKGSGDFSSVTFWVSIPNHKKKIRFWAKLTDVNNLEVEEVGERIIPVPNLNFDKVRYLDNGFTVKEGPFWAHIQPIATDEKSQTYPITVLGDTLYHVRYEYEIAIQTDTRTFLGITTKVNESSHVKDLKVLLLDSNMNTIREFTSFESMRNYAKKVHKTQYTKNAKV